jgi:hypothetical protein
MKETIRRPLSIEVLPYLRDHRSEGKAVLPAVEALQRLALSAQEHFPEIHAQAMYRASFPRFLVIEPEDRNIEAYGEFVVNDGGSLRADLVTLSVSPKMRIGRSRVYASVCFKEAPPDIDLPAGDAAFDIGEDAFALSAEQLYRELVPLGPSYRNACEPIYLGRPGATGCLKAPVLPAPVEPLGSPFPFDAAMHCACAWSQRYYGVIAFPVGFERRIIRRKTRPGENYRCRIVPVSEQKGVLTFDIRIDDEQGDLCELITGVKMQDVTAGRLSPPRWVRDSA